MKYLTSFLDNYYKKLYEAEKIGEGCGNKICELVRPIIPDIECSIGSRDDNTVGPDTICFYSKSKNIDQYNAWARSLIGFEKVLREIFSNNTYRFYCPIGISLTKLEVAEIENIFKTQEVIR